MGARTVIGVDGRTWSVRRSVAWSLPATGDDFEHDVDGGRGAAVLILSSLFLFWVIIIVWSPSGVHATRSNGKYTGHGTGTAVGSVTATEKLYPRPA